MSCCSDLLPTRHPAVIFNKVAEGAVLLHTVDEVYFGLNAVGAFIWELLPPRSDTLEQLCEAVALRYPDAPLVAIRDDVLELLAELERNGLVVATGSPAEMPT